MKAIVFGQCCLWVVIFGCSSVWAQSQPDETPLTKEQVSQRLQGEWRPESAILAGDKLPDELVQSLRLTIKESSFEVRHGDQLQDSGTLDYDVTETPWKMSIRSKSGANASKTFPSIFKFAEDKLTICYRVEGDEFPEGFESPEGSTLLLITYSRPPKAPAVDRIR